MKRGREERRNDENKFHAREEGAREGGGNGNSIGDIPKRIAEREGCFSMKNTKQRSGSVLDKQREREREKGTYTCTVEYCIRIHGVTAIYGGALTSSPPGGRVVRPMS